MMKEHNTFESWKNISPLVNSDKDVNKNKSAHVFYLLQ